MIKGIRQGKIGGKGKLTKREPRSFCLLCTALFNWGWATKGELKSCQEGVCDKCLKRLNSGWIAVKDPEGRVVFVKSEELATVLQEEFGKKVQIVEMDKDRFQMVLNEHDFELPELPDLPGFPPSKPSQDEPANPPSPADGPAPTN